MFTKTIKKKEQYKKLMEGTIKALGNPQVKQIMSN